MDNTTSIEANWSLKSSERTKTGVFLAATIGYGLFYVCRLSLNVLKKSIVDTGYLTESELGIIGSALFFSYAIGKFVNGFLADRLNVRLFMAVGLFMAALINLILGFKVSFICFVILWGMNGWFQSIGSPCCVISLRRWYTEKELGPVYGYWSASHNIGEAMTFIITAFIVSLFGWQSGFFSSSILGFIGVALILVFLKLSPDTASNINKIPQKKVQQEIGKSQLAVIKNPMIWLLAMGSAFMYIARYAVNSWGIYYFEIEKGYSLVEASSLISVSSVCGIIGTIFSGAFSAKFFGGNRTLPAVIMSLINLCSLALFLFGPIRNYYMDMVFMILFGISIGVLICFLGGLMAVDLAPKSASGAALGIIGVASYLGAGLQDIVSGWLFESQKVFNEAGTITYNFSSIRFFWLFSAAMSLLFLLLILFLQKNRIVNSNAK